MPETAIAGVEARIAELVQAHRPELEQLVREQFDRLAAELVDLELTRRGNGAATSVTPKGSHSSATRRCNRCGIEKPTGAFDKHRGTCRECRRSQEREREHRRASTAADAEPPHPRDRAD